MSFKMLSVFVLMVIGLVLVAPVAGTLRGVAHAEEVHFAGSKVVQGAGTVANKTGSSDTPLKVFVGIILTAFVITTIGVIMGLSDKAVFYDDGRDVLASLIPAMVPPVLLFLLMLTAGLIFEGRGMDEQAIKRVVILIVAAVEVLAIAWVFRISYRQNDGKVVVGVIMAISKMSLSWLCLGMLKQAMGWDSSKSAAQNWAGRANAAIIFVVIVALMKKLVNGERVRQKISYQTAQA